MDVKELLFKALKAFRTLPNRRPGLASGYCDSFWISSSCFICLYIFYEIRNE